MTEESPHNARHSADVNQQLMAINHLMSPSPTPPRLNHRNDHHNPPIQRALTTIISTSPLPIHW